MVDPTPEPIAEYYKDISFFRDANNKQKQKQTLKVMVELFASFAPI